MRMLKLLPYRLAVPLRRFREEGLVAGVLSLGQLVTRICYTHSEYVIAANMLSDKINWPAVRSGLTIHQIRAREEIADLSAIAESVDMARFYKMFKHGSICFCGFRNGEIVGYWWVSQEVERRVNPIQPPLGPGDACIHDGFISAKHRGEGIAESLAYHCLRFLSERGYKRAIEATEKTNSVMQRVEKKTGFIIIGEMLHTRILFWESLRYKIRQ